MTLDPCGYDSFAAGPVKPQSRRVALRALFGVYRHGVHSMRPLGHFESRVKRVWQDRSIQTRSGSAEEVDLGEAPQRRDHGIQARLMSNAFVGHVGSRTAE